MTSTRYLNIIASFIVTSTLLLLMHGCTIFVREGHQPLYRLSQDQYPQFTDDFDRDSLIICLSNQISSLKKQSPNKAVSFGHNTYTISWLLYSAEELLQKLKDNPDNAELASFVSAHYLVYQAGGRMEQPSRQMLVTGYYEPIFAGNTTKEPPYSFPLYSPPSTLVRVMGSNNNSRFYRYDSNNSLISFWSRAEIENTGILAGNELVYLKDPFEAFLLHIQGSGKIVLPDQTVRTIRFAASNGHEYKSIGKLLVDEKKMHLDDVNIPAIRSYLDQYPDDRQRILQHNPRFIFFKWGDDLGPIGSCGEQLIPGRSIAIDQDVLPGGSIGFLVSRLPYLQTDGATKGYKPMARFVFPQDSGAAIQGAGRVDIFLGHGSSAEFAAHHMKEEGQLYFLVKKGYPPTF